MVFWAEFASPIAALRCAIAIQSAQWRVFFALLVFDTSGFKTFWKGRAAMSVLNGRATNRLRSPMGHREFLAEVICGAKVELTRSVGATESQLITIKAPPPLPL